MNATATHLLPPDRPQGLPQTEAGLSRPLPTAGEPQAWESMRLGQAVAQRLSQATAALHPDVESRLRFAREQALARAREAAGTAAAPAPAASAAALQGWRAWSPAVATGAGNFAPRALTAPGGDPGSRRPSWAQRLLAVLPLLLLLAGLQWVHEANQRERVLAMAELDAELLTNELHPVLYSDPGFTEFLRDPSP